MSVFALRGFFTLREEDFFAVLAVEGYLNSFCFLLIFCFFVLTTRSQCFDTSFQPFFTTALTVVATSFLSAISS